MSSLDHGRARLLTLLRDFAGLAPESESDSVRFSRFVKDSPNCASRDLKSGHLTGSAWLVSQDGRHVLLTHHRKLKRWLQLGGHADGDLDLAAVALREAREESGLPDLAVEPDIFDLDAHHIPARGDEPEHTHWDIRFVVRAGADEDFVLSEESIELAWMNIIDLANDLAFDESLRRMARRWLARSAQK
jgi:8-oxo-dGTP pyrophosphatase MutT (NUDIX family)